MTSFSLDPVDDPLLLNAPWPDDLDPATVPFRERSVTILRRAGYFDDPSLFDTLTEGDVLSWTNAGPKTLVDIRDTSNEAMQRHQAEPTRRAQLHSGLVAAAGASWAKHVWYRDPRFAEYLPKGDATVHDIATNGTLEDQEALWSSLGALRDAVTAQSALTLPEAVAQYVEAITGWHGHRLETILGRTGLNGTDPIKGVEAAKRLGVSHQAVTQFVQRLWRLRDRASPPAGAWIPQIGEAERDGWPREYTETGIEATRAFFGVIDNP